MADDFASTFRTFGRKHVNRALERIECACLALILNFEGLVVIVSAAIASGHCKPPVRRSRPAATLRVRKRRRAG
jgi:hypothetical protein